MPEKKCDDIIGDSSADGCPPVDSRNRPLGVCARMPVSDRACEQIKEVRWCDIRRYEDTKKGRWCESDIPEEDKAKFENEKLLQNSKEKKVFLTR